MTAALAENDALTPTALRDDPERFIRMNTTERFSIPTEQVHAMQLGALRARFDDLVGRVPTLAKFAEGQRLERIESLEDGALLLFPHTLYKSYPLTAINNARFDVMTKWLSSLTAVDLSSVDGARCEDIDAWIAALDAGSELRVVHSSGTTGKMSFVPTSIGDSRLKALNFKSFYSGFGDEPNAAITDFEATPMLSFSARKGTQGTARILDALVEFVYGGNEDMVIALWPTTGISADLLALGSRLEGARATGDRGAIQLSPSLVAKREQAVRDQAEQPRRLREFFERLDRDRGRKVYYKGVVPTVVETAVAGLNQGYEGLVAPESVGSLTGGTKGRSLPEDYREIVSRFLGPAYPAPGYGMSESVSAVSRMCPAGHYHVQPMIIPYLLEPESGTPYPRTGRHTGRYGIIDLCAVTRWGGFLTGDRVTLDWGDEAPCACGRIGPYLLPDIRRYSEAEGGDDKITCAGAQDVQDKALAFIASYSED